MSIKGGLCFVVVLMGLTETKLRLKHAHLKFSDLKVSHQPNSLLRPPHY